MVSFLALLAVDVLGLAAIWFFLKSRLNRALGLESLLESVRKEVRALDIELNETADRNVSLLEDRMKSLRELLDEADRRMGVVKRELGRREAEREVYSQLGRKAHRQPQASPAPKGEEAPELFAEPKAGPAQTAAAAPLPPEPSPPPAGEEPIKLSLGRPQRPLPEVSRAAESVIPPKSRREEALELYRQGFSADIIAVRLGATVAEIELLVSLEEGRSRGFGEHPAG